MKRSKKKKQVESKRVSRRDVAKAAKVSVTTVTHALNPPPGVRVKPATVERVKRVARELGYRPNFIGRALVSGRTHTVAVVLPSHDVTKLQLYQDILIGMTRAMDEDDYALLLVFMSDDGRYLTPITQGRVDGVFVLQSARHTEHITRVIDTGIPTVVVNKHFKVPDDKPAACVGSDHHEMMVQAVEELVEMNCKTLLLVVDIRWVDANAVLYSVFVDVCYRYRDRGVVGSVINPAHEGQFKTEILNAFQSGQRWDGMIMDRLSDADDLLEAADATGLKANHDFHLISIDTQDGGATRTRREFCAFNQQPALMGAEAWRTLHAMIDGDLPEEQILKVPYKRYPVGDSSSAASEVD